MHYVRCHSHRLVRLSMRPGPLLACCFCVSHAGLVRDHTTCREGLGKKVIHDTASATLAKCIRTTEAEVDEETAIPAVASRDRSGIWHDAVLDITVAPSSASDSNVLDLSFTSCTSTGNVSFTRAHVSTPLSTVKQRGRSPMPTRLPSPQEAACLQHCNTSTHLKHLPPCRQQTHGWHPLDD